MSAEDNLSKQEAFLLSYSEIYELRECVCQLCEELEKVVGPGLEQCYAMGEVCMKAGVEDFEYVNVEDFEYVNSALKDLLVKLEEEMIRCLPVEVTAGIKEATDYIRKGLPTRDDTRGNEQYLFGGYYNLALERGKLHDWMYSIALETFGRWGAFWFNTLILGDGPNHFLFCDYSPKKIISALLSPAINDSEKEWIKATHDRDLWVYEQVMAGKKYRTIISELKSKPIKWQRISTVPGIKSVAFNYAVRYGLPLPKPRPPGRPTAREE